MSEVFQGSLQVDTEHLFPIIKKWLYSEHDIFLRELLSNSNDAIYKLQRLSSIGQYKGVVEKPRVDIRIDKANKIISIEDNGIGMSFEEVQKYINKIAFSGAKEFIEKYQTDEKGGIIGHFGMGFFSCFMVAKKVCLETLSYQPNSEPVLWECDGSTEFSMQKGSKESMGTKITLHINDESTDFLDEAKIRQLVIRYSNYLPMDIRVNGATCNKQNPIWAQAQEKLTQDDYKSFYRENFPDGLDPLFWIPIRVEYPFYMRGVIYFPRQQGEFDPRRKGRIQLYCNNVFVSDNIVDIIPPHLNLLQGVIDSTDIPLNVSRSALQGDPKVTKMGQHIVSKIIEKIQELCQKDRSKYEEIWPDFEVFIKFACLSDGEFCDKVKNIILFKTSENTYVTLDEYDHNKNPGRKILYTNDPQKHYSYVERLKQDGNSVLYIYHPIDTHFLPYLESKLGSVSFQRVDGGSDVLCQDSSLLPGFDASKAKDLFETVLEKKSPLQIEVLQLKGDYPPCMLILSEYFRRLQEMSVADPQRKETNTLDQLGGMKLVLNGNHPVIQKLSTKKSDEVSKRICKILYQMAALQAGVLQGKDIDALQTDVSTTILDFMAPSSLLEESI